MSEDVKKLWIISIIFLICIVLQLFMHENIHASIFADYGIESQIKYNLNPFNNLSYAGLTIPIGNTSRCDSICDGLQASNELFSGYLMFFMTMTYIILYSVFLYKYLKS